MTNEKEVKVSAVVKVAKLKDMERPYVSPVLYDTVKEAVDSFKSRERLGTEVEWVVGIPIVVDKEKFTVEQAGEAVRIQLESVAGTEKETENGKEA